MTTIHYIFYFVLAIQMWLTVRYVAKAIVKDVPNYKVYKLAIVLFVPIIGYILMTKETDEIEYP